MLSWLHCPLKAQLLEYMYTETKRGNVTRDYDIVLSFPQERRGAQNMITSQNLIHCNDHIKGYMSMKVGSTLVPPFWGKHC